MHDDSTVVDSSTWISALQFGGIPRRAIDSIAEHSRIACCAYIRAEVERTLVNKFGWTRAEVRADMAHYLGASADVVLPGKLRGVCRDPNDDLILQCAIFSKAQIIVTGDMYLLALNPYEILSARQYLDLLAVR